MDTETKQILSEQKSLQSLVASEAWGVARNKLIEKIQDLQNAFNIEDSDPQKMLIDLRARKIATDILFSFLREIEGTAQTAVQNEPLIKEYIVKL